MSCRGENGSFQAVWKPQIHLSLQTEAELPHNWGWSVIVHMRHGRQEHFHVEFWKKLWPSSIMTSYWLFWWRDKAQKGAHVVWDEMVRVSAWDDVDFDPSWWFWRQQDVELADFGIQRKSRTQTACVLSKKTSFIIIHYWGSSRSAQPWIIFHQLHPNPMKE